MTQCGSSIILMSVMETAKRGKLTHYITRLERKTDGGFLEIFFLFLFFLTHFSAVASVGDSVGGRSFCPRRDGLMRRPFANGSGIRQQ